MARGIDFVFPSVTDQIIITWQLASAPLVEVGREVFPPSVDFQTCIPLGLQKKVYIFRFYSSSDGVTLETQLRPDWSVDGEMFGNVMEVYHYVVGGPASYDPAADQDTITDPRLAGKEYTVFSRGTGPRRPDEIVVDPTGGFSLVGGELFNNEDTWTVIVSGEQTGAASELQAGIQEISVNSTFDDTYFGLTSVIKGSGAKLTITFPAFAGIANGAAKFTTYTGTQRYLVLDFGEDTIDHAGEERNYLALAADEMVEITFKDGVAYVTDAEMKINEAGETVFTNNKNKRGTFLCDGSGTEYNIADFQRVIDNLPEEMKVSYSDWNLTQNKTTGIITKTYYKNRGKFAIDNINGKFKFPDGRGYAFKGLIEFDGTSNPYMLSQGSGGVIPQQHISHKHTAKEGDSSVLYVKRKPGGPGGGLGLNAAGSGWELAEQYSGSDGGASNEVDSLGKYVVVIL